MAGCQKGPGTPSQSDGKSGEAREQRSSGRHEQTLTQQGFKVETHLSFHTTLGSRLGNVKHFFPHFFAVSAVVGWGESSRPALQFLRQSHATHCAACYSSVSRSRLPQPHPLADSLSARQLLYFWSWRSEE